MVNAITTIITHTQRISESVLIASAIVINLCGSVFLTRSKLLPFWWRVLIVLKFDGEGVDIGDDDAKRKNDETGDDRNMLTFF